MKADVPDDLRAFLRAGRQLQYDTSFCEPGQVELLPLDLLSPGRVWIPARPDWDPQGDPHAGEDGYYYLLAVNLVAAAEGYDPAFILLWLPGEGMYATWDNEHYTLFVFPNMTWSGIAANPRPYIAAQWEWPKPAVEFVPSAAHSHLFKAGPLRWEPDSEQGAAADGGS